MILSAPSYVIPGTYLENVQAIDAFPEIKGIEFLFFSFDRDSWSLFRKEKDTLRSFSGRFSFSLHMPELLKEEHEELIEGTLDLVSSYVVHPDLLDPEFFLLTLSKWIERYGNIFYLENILDGNIERFLKLLPEAPLCMDTGHLLLEGRQPARFYTDWKQRIKKIHFHSISRGRDHRASAGDEPWIRKLVPLLKTFNGILHIEIFRKDEYFKMIENLRIYPELFNG